MRHKHADLIHAWADGAEIQCKSHKNDKWEDVGTPAWGEHFFYRIKPETKKDFVHEFRIGMYKQVSHGVRLEIGHNNLRLIFDGETEELKSAEVLK